MRYISMPSKMVSKKCKTCVFCNYEISKFRLIRYKKNLVPVCFDCTPKNKACMLKYNECYVDCGVCSKLVRGKNLVECKICSHLIHLACVDPDLDKKDTDKYTDWYMCKLCIKENLPIGLLTSQSNTCTKREKMKEIQCFTCTNIVPKREKYCNKSIIYDSKKVWLCKNCSNNISNIPVKNKLLLEKLNCSVCTKIVKYQSILCDTCQSWIHPQCCNISKSQLRSKLAVSKNKWECPKCKPQCVSNLSQNYSSSEEFKLFDDCSICCKTVTNNMSINCSLC